MQYHDQRWPPNFFDVCARAGRCRRCPKKRKPAETVGGLSLCIENAMRSRQYRVVRNLMSKTGISPERQGEDKFYQDSGRSSAKLASET